MSVDFHLPLGPKGDELTAGPEGEAAAGSEAGRAQALRAFAAAARREPCDPDYAFVLACAQLVSGHAAEAVERCRAAIPLGHVRPEYHFTLGCALWQLDRADEAAEAFAEAVRLQPGDADLLTAQAAALLRCGRQLEAEAAYAAALAADPQLAEAHGGLGVLRWQRGCEEEALEALRRASTLRPDARHLLRNYGLALMASGRVPAGLGVLRRATSARSAGTEAWLDLAQAAWSAGQRDEATAALEQAARLDPAAISRRPQSLAIRDALQLESLRRETQSERPSGLGVLAASTMFRAAELAGGVLGRLRPGRWPLMAAVLLLFVAAARLVPPYVRHQLLRDDVAQVARTPILSDGVVHERLAYVFEARHVRPGLADACVVTTHPPLRRITCAYSLPVSIVPGVEHMLWFRIDTEQPFVLRED